MTSRSTPSLGRCLGHWGLAGMLLGAAYGLAFLVLASLAVGEASFLLAISPVAALFGAVLGGLAGLVLGFANCLLIEVITCGFPHDWDPSSLPTAARVYSFVLALIVTPLVLKFLVAALSMDLGSYIWFLVPGLLAGLSSWWLIGRVTEDIPPYGSGGQ